MSSPTRVTIGLPVYNGAELLPQAFESLLGQTYEDFTLLVVDNASTDATEAVCREWAARDARIRYVRNERNLGGIANFNRAFELNESPYFKWAACDDVCLPGFLEATVAALDADPEAVLAIPRSTVIDEYGRLLPYDAEQQAYVTRSGPWIYSERCEAGLTAPDPAARFRTALRGSCIGTVVYGLFRADALRATGLHQHHGSDRLLMAEVMLRGRVVRVDEVLFQRRLHTAGSWLLSRRELMHYEQGSGAVLTPPWRTALNYLAAVCRADLPLTTRVRCLAAVVAYAVRRDSLKNLVVPGPENYWGMDGSRRARGPEPAVAHV